MRAMKKMGVHKKAVRGIRLGFQVNMLLGDRAHERYEYDRQRVTKRFHSTRAYALDADTTLGGLVLELYESEFEVGDYFIAAAVAGDPVTWEAAAERNAPSARWKIINQVKREGKHDKGYVKLIARITKETVERCWRLAVLRAAEAVANKQRPYLADYIAVRGEFRWEDLAAMLVRAFGTRRQSGRVELPTALGELQWG